MGEGKTGTHPGTSVPWPRGLARCLAGLTRSLYSARLRMTAVICWSMKMRIDSSRAGRAAATLSHQGLVPKDDTSQSRPGSVGWGRTFHGQIGEGFPRAPHLCTPALAFPHPPYHKPSPPIPWMVGGSSGCVCIAGLKHPRALKRAEGGRPAWDSRVRVSALWFSGPFPPCKGRRRWMRPAHTFWCIELSSLGNPSQLPGWGDSGSDLP